MKSRRSFDNGVIWILRHDQFKQDLQSIVAGENTILLEIGGFGVFRKMKFSNDLFHNRAS
jgi:hypothetical protein